jgi:hypothetical protein
MLLTFCIPDRFFIGCQDKILPLESNNNDDENHLLSNKMLVDDADDDLEAIEEATAKIAEATDKLVAVTVAVDLTTVKTKIAEAEAKLVEAQTFYDNGDYIDALNSGIEVKELAEEAIELLEAILDVFEDIRMMTILMKKLQTVTMDKMSQFILMH